MDNTIPLQLLNEHLNFCNVEKAPSYIDEHPRHQLSGIRIPEIFNITLRASPMDLLFQNFNTEWRK